MMITEAIATAVAILVIVAGRYATKHAQEYPEWFKEEMSWGEWEKLKKEKKADSENKQKHN